MKKLRQDFKAAIAEEVRFQIGPRKIDACSGQILECFRADICFAFECHARSYEQAREIILRDAEVYLNKLFEEDPLAKIKPRTFDRHGVPTAWWSDEFQEKLECHPKLKEMHEKAANHESK